MQLTRKTRLGDLLDAFPAARSVFEDSGIDLEEMDREASLSVVARLSDVDIEELLAELRQECDVDEDDFTYGGPAKKRAGGGDFDDDDGDDDYGGDDLDGYGAF